jgi:transcriptional regulator of acetoin/glycerol metabolism
VRELEHVIEHGVLLSPRPLITVEDLPQELRAVSKSAPARPAAETDNLPEMILSALEKTGWNKALAARLLDMGRTTLYRKIKDYGIKADSPFKRKS